MHKVLFALAPTCSQRNVLFLQKTTIVVVYIISVLMIHHGHTIHFLYKYNINRQITKKYLFVNIYIRLQTEPCKKGALAMRFRYVHFAEGRG